MPTMLLGPLPAPRHLVLPWHKMDSHVMEAEEDHLSLWVGATHKEEGVAVVGVEVLI